MPFSDPFANIEAYRHEKRTDLKYDAVDGHGWSVMHHLVNASPLGAYQNLVMLKYLTDAGVPLDLKDKQGLTPLQHALNRGATQLACAIQHKLGVPKTDWVSNSYISIFQRELQIITYAFLGKL